MTGHWKDDEVQRFTKADRLGQAIKTSSETHPVRSAAIKAKDEWKWLQVFEDIDVYEDTALATFHDEDTEIDQTAAQRQQRRPEVNPSVWT